MKKIAFITSSRSDYAIIEPIVNSIRTGKKYEDILIVTGAHLTKNFGKTIHEMEGVKERVDILQAADNHVATATSIGVGVIKFSELLVRKKPDLLVLPGDRFEIFAAGVAAYCCNIPMLHLYGGENTNGSQDNAWRGCLTEYAQYHVVMHRQYESNIKARKPNASVCCAGAIHEHNIHTMQHLSQEETCRIAGASEYILVTYHPETIYPKKEVISKYQILLRALEHVKMGVVMTFANQDSGGNEINRMLAEFKRTKQNVRYIKTAGAKVYLSLLKYAHAVVGNSSSGIIEAPYYGTPTINIGNRQDGRVKAKSIKDVGYDEGEILKTIMGAKRFMPENIFGVDVLEKIMKYVEEICQ